MGYFEQLNAIWRYSWGSCSIGHFKPNKWRTLIKQYYRAVWRHLESLCAVFSVHTYYFKLRTKSLLWSVVARLVGCHIWLPKVIVHDSTSYRFDFMQKITPTAMKPGGVFSELYVLKKLLFCFVDSGFYLSVRIIEFFRQLFVGSTIKQTAFQYGSVSFVEYP